MASTGHARNDRGTYGNFIQLISKLPRELRDQIYELLLDGNLLPLRFHVDGAVTRKVSGFDYVPPLPGHLNAECLGPVLFFELSVRAAELYPEDERWLKMDIRNLLVSPPDEHLVMGRPWNAFYRKIAFDLMYSQAAAAFRQTDVEKFTNRIEAAE
jgi:hypothetical protein